MKKNSWHYQLAKLGNNGNVIYSGEMTICQYTQKVLSGLGIMFGLFMLATLAITFISMALYETIGSIGGFAEFSAVSGIFYTLVLLILLSVAWDSAKGYLYDKTEYLLNRENKSLTASVYKSYKEKICFKVDFNDE